MRTSYRDCLQIIFQNVQSMDWSWNDVHMALDEFFDSMVRLGNLDWNLIKSEDILDYKIFTKKSSANNNNNNNNNIENKEDEKSDSVDTNMDNNTTITTTITKTRKRKKMITMTLRIGTQPQTTPTPNL